VSEGRVRLLTWGYSRYTPSEYVYGSCTPLCKNSFSFSPLLLGEGVRRTGEVACKGLFTFASYGGIAMPRNVSVDIKWLNIDYKQANLKKTKEPIY